jgi:Flp pilus assembly protein TadD
LPAAKDVNGWLDRYRLEVALLDFEAAARIGERLLDLTRDAELMKIVRMPFLLDQLQLRGLPDGFKKRCLAAADRCVRRQPGLPWGRWFRRLLRRSFALDPKLAAEDTARLREASSTRYPWGYDLGRDCLSAGDFAGAVAEFKKAVAYARNKDWLAQCSLGEALACSGRLDDAWRAFELAAAMVRGEATAGRVWAWHGSVLLWAGRYRRALVLLDRAVAEEDPRYAYGWRGAALFKLGRPAEALRSLSKGIALLPRDIETRIWRAEALLRLERLTDARREIEAAAALNRFEKNIYFHVVRGLISGRRGDARAMRRDHDAAEALHPEAFAFARRRARLRAEDRAERIEETLEAVLSLSRGLRRGDHELALWMR